MINEAIIVSESEGIKLDQEVDEGTIYITPDTGYNYVWINNMGTQLLFLSMISNTYPSPVRVFLAEHFYSLNKNIEIFTGSELSYIEVYNDTNNNHRIDSNFTANPINSELTYYLIINASKSFLISPVTKMDRENGSSYEWGIKYLEVQAGLVKTPLGPIWDVTDLIIPFLEFNYQYIVDLSVNKTILKNTFKMGSVEEKYKDLFRKSSLSLLYSSFNYVTNHSTALINESVLLSPSNINTTFFLNDLSQEYKDFRMWENIFKSNYTLDFENQGSEYEISTINAPSNTIDPEMFSSGHLNFIQISNYLSSLLPPIYSNIDSLALNRSLAFDNPFIRYRICYPEWSGSSLDHDPWMISYFTPIENPTSEILFDLSVIATLSIFVVGVVTLSIALIRWKELLVNR